MEAFLAYPSAEGEVAVKLCNELEKLGLKVWLDRRELQEGMDWRQAAEKAIQEAPNLLLLIGPGDGRDKKQEVYWRMALEAVWKDRDKRLIPILLNGARLPNFVRASLKVDEDLPAIRIDDPRKLDTTARLIAHLVRGRDLPRRGVRGVRGREEPASVFKVGPSDRQELVARLHEIAQYARNLKII
jgi:TIR domain